MDLRDYELTPQQIATAKNVLDYQPFIITDSVQTGVAYSWLYGDEGGRTSHGKDFICERDKVSEQQYSKFCDANLALRDMYDDWLDVIAQSYPGGTLLDPACNNGYFPVGAIKRGMSVATGYDRADYTKSVAFLNKVVGTNAIFNHRAYDPKQQHTIPGCKQHDVAVASLILCHISDPLYYLSFLGKMAKEAIFLFSGMGVEPGYRIYYSKPNKFYTSDTFPVCFDNDVGLSKDLLFDSLEMMGFKNIKVLPHQDNWLPKSWYDTGNQLAILAMR